MFYAGRLRELAAEEEANATPPAGGPGPAPVVEPRPVGVLVVHGIGEQRRGTTLRQFGDPLARAFDKRLHAVGGSSQVLVDQKASAGEPAYFSISLSTPTRGAREVLVAESRWAESFQPASFNAMRGWAVRRGLATMRTAGARAVGGLKSSDDRVSDLRQRFSDMSKAIPFIGGLYRAVLDPFSTLAAAIRLVLLLAALVAALGLVVLSGLLPLVIVFLVVGRLWKKTRGIASDAREGLAASLGDAFTFVRRPIDRAAMVAQVRYDLAWLSGQVDEVVVVAHSLGSAVAVEALRPDGPHKEKVDTLYTLGNALAAVRVARRTNWWGLASFESMRLEGVRLIDMSSSQDVVTLGKLTAATGEPYVYRRIDNEHSVLRDHTAYFDNAEQVLGVVMADLLERANLADEAGSLSPRVDAAGVLRRTRKNAETSATLAALLAVAGVVLAASAGLLQGFGRWCYDLGGGLLGTLPDNVEDPARDFLEGDNGRLLVGGLASTAVLALVSSAVVGMVAQRRNRVAADRLWSTDGRLHRSGVLTAPVWALVFSLAGLGLHVLRARWDLSSTWVSVTSFYLLLAAFVVAFAAAIWEELVSRTYDMDQTRGVVLRHLLKADLPSDLSIGALRSALKR